MRSSVIYLAPALLGLLLPLEGSSLSTSEKEVPSSSWSSAAHRIRSQIERTFHVRGGLSSREVKQMIRRAIDEGNPRGVGLGEEASSQLAREMVRSAKCYGVDPVVLAALIWRESNFKPSARSERGAVGLTQMTNSGIREVLDRLSPDSSRRLGYLRRLVASCHPALLARVGPGSVTPEELSEWKVRLQDRHSDAIAFGVLLLKINLAASRPTIGFGDEALTRYQRALERYNGDPVIKERFAKDVLLLAKRMWEPPSVALNESKFLRLIRGL